MAKGIFMKAVRLLLDPEDKNQDRKPFHIKCGTLDGDVIEGDVICTSSNFKNDTFNVKFVNSGEMRTVHASLLASINQIPVML